MIFGPDSFETEPELQPVEDEESRTAHSPPGGTGFHRAAPAHRTAPAEEEEEASRPVDKSRADRVAGIGVFFALRSDGFHIVEQLLPGGPAERSGQIAIGKKEQ